MEVDYTKYPELLPATATCNTCGKGRKGSGSCPIKDRGKGCPAWIKLTDADRPPPPLQMKMDAQPPPLAPVVPKELIPALVHEDVARLAEAVLRVWSIQMGDGDLSKYAIVNYRNPAMGPAYARFKSRAADLLGGRTITDDMSYVLWALMMLGSGARKEYAKYCERMELQHEIDRKEGQAS